MLILMEEIPERYSGISFSAPPKPICGTSPLLFQEPRGQVRRVLPFWSFECGTGSSCPSLAVQTANSKKQFQTFNQQISGFCGLLVDSLKIIRHIYPLAVIFDSTVHPFSPCYPQFVNKCTGQPMFSPQATVFVGVAKDLSLPPFTS